MFIPQTYPNKSKNWVRKLFAMALVVISNTSGSIGANQSPPTHPVKGTSTTHTITEPQSESEFNVRVGDTILVTLAANPTTGYSWGVASPIQAWLILVDTSYHQIENTIGGGGQTTFRFFALRPGECTLVLSYRRPWERGVPPVKNVTLTLHIDT